MAINDTLHPIASKDDTSTNDTIKAMTLSDKGKSVSISQSDKDISAVPTFAQKGRALFKQRDIFTPTGSHTLELTPDKQYFLNTVGVLSRDTPLTKVIDNFIRVCEKMRALTGASRNSVTGRIQESNNILEEGTKPLPIYHRGVAIPNVSGSSYTDSDGVKWIDVIKNYNSLKAAVDAEKDPDSRAKYWMILRQAAALYDAIKTVRGRELTPAEGNPYLWRDEDEDTRKSRIKREKREAITAAKEYIRNTGVAVEMREEDGKLQAVVPDSITDKSAIEAYKQAAIDEFNKTPRKRIVVTPIDLKPPAGYRAAIKKTSPFFSDGSGVLYTEVEFRKKTKRGAHSKAPTPPPANKTEVEDVLQPPPKISLPPIEQVSTPSVQEVDAAEVFPVEVIEQHSCRPFNGNGTVADADCFIKIMQSRVVEGARTGRGVSPYVLAADYLQYDSGEQVAKQDPKPGQFVRYGQDRSIVPEAADKMPTPTIRTPGQSYRGEVIGTHRAQEREGLMQATEQQTHNVHKAIIKAFIEPGYLVYMTPQAYHSSKKSVLRKLVKQDAWSAGV